MRNLTYDQFNRQEVLKKFAETAGELNGREMRVILSKLKPDERQARSLDELKNFPEVKFVN